MEVRNLPRFYLGLNSKAMKIKNLFLYCLVLIIQGCTSDYSKNLGEGYFYRDEGGKIKDILCEKPNGKEVPATVLDYAYDNEFIIAKQEPKLPQDPLYDRNYEYRKGKNTLYFWIILKEKDIAFGPMDKVEFTTKTKELGIKLKFEE